MRVVLPRFLVFAFFFAICLNFSSAPAFAHHGFAVEFDRNSPVTLSGVVTNVEFKNPHIYFYLDVKDKNGKVTNWAFEGGPPNVLYRQGWRKDTIKAGDTLTVKGYRARDGSPLAACTKVTLPDGREISPGAAPVDDSPSNAAPDGNKK